MSQTLRETLAAKVTELETELASLKADLEALEAKAAPILEQDLEAVKTWVGAIVKHLGL